MMELEICARPYKFTFLHTLDYEYNYSAIIYRLYFSQLGISISFTHVYVSFGFFEFYFLALPR